MGDPFSGERLGCTGLEGFWPCLDSSGVWWRPPRETECQYVDVVKKMNSVSTSRSTYKSNLVAHSMSVQNIVIIDK